jgi:hypothetical protein
LGYSNLFPNSCKKTYTLDRNMRNAVHSWVHASKRHVGFGKADESLVCSDTSLTVSSNLHYYVKNKYNRWINVLFFVSFYLFKLQMGFYPVAVILLYNVRGYLTSSDHQLYRVAPLKTPFGLVVPLLQSQSHVTTITHNYFSRCATFTQLTIIHVRDYNRLLHSYTGWLLSYRLLSQIITHFASSHFPCLSPIETSLIGLLRKNWLLRHFSSSYKPTIVRARWELCCVRSLCLPVLPWKRACCRVTSSRPAV